MKPLYTPREMAQDAEHARKPSPPTAQAESSGPPSRVGKQFMNSEPDSRPTSCAHHSRPDYAEDSEIPGPMDEHSQLHDDGCNVTMPTSMITRQEPDQHTMAKSSNGASDEESKDSAAHALGCTSHLDGIIFKTQNGGKPTEIYRESCTVRSPTLQRWWQPTDGGLRKELLALEPEFHAVFDQRAIDGVLSQSAFTDLANDWRKSVGGKQMAATMDWHPIFKAADANADGNVDWQEFWSFFSSAQMMGNTLRDYVTITKLLKAWGAHDQVAKV